LNYYQLLALPETGIPGFSVSIFNLSSREMPETNQAALPV
jgi:hypothetical protein